MNNHTQESNEKKKPAVSRWSWLKQAAILVFCFALLQTWFNRSLLRSGSKAPSFVLKTHQGKKISLQQLRGKKVILHFWATWCTACKANLYTHSWVQKSYDQDPVLLSILVDPHHKQALKRIVKKHKLTYPILYGSQQLARQFKVNRFPTTYFLDKHGKIVFRDTGIITPFGLWWRSFLL